MRYLSLVYLALCISFVSCQDTPVLADKKYVESKALLAERERGEPLAFLKVSGKMKRNIIGQTVINAAVTNNASVTKYHQVRVKVLYFNKEKVLIENHEDVLDKVIIPGVVHKFKTKYFTPKGTDSIDMQIMSAEPLNNKN